MPPDPHILHVFSSAGLYGAEHAVLGLIPALERLGIRNTLACIDNPHLDQQPLYARACELGIASRRIPCKGRLDASTTLAIRALLECTPGTILHVHGYKSAFYALRARRNHPRSPVVSTLHGWTTNSGALWLYRLLELWMLRRIQRVCIVASSMQQPLLDAGIPADRIRLVENGIDTSRFRMKDRGMLREELGIPEDAFVFGGVMRLSEEKNPVGLLEAFARIAQECPRAWLVLAGDGPQRQEVERLARELKLGERMRLLGARRDVENIYPGFDCFVLPSLTEGLPLALLEAMACECPIIASRVGQIPAVLEDLPVSLVTAGDTSGLTEAMRKNMHPRTRLTALRQRVEARYSVARMARDYAAVYRELGANDVTQAA
jgi:glycosyltransferase involved in cell wall biosynthesis